MGLELNFFLLYYNQGKIKGGNRNGNREKI